MSKLPDLEKYKQKRDFSKTPEPSGEQKIDAEHPLFTIQKHDASNLHYDFRLEIDGVLASWVIPKGPSTDHSIKRLAIPTEDHPLDYAQFEGVIPEDQYGAGTVIVWDFGSYENAKDYSMQQAKEQGKIEVFLKGEKLKGRYALIRTGPKSENARWLLIKMKDEYADAGRNPVSTQPESVLSGKTIEEIKSD